MNIEKQLQEYKENYTRLKYLRKELLLLMSPEFFPDSVSYYSSPVFENDVKQNINKFHSITENAGIKLETVNKKIQEKIDRLKKEIMIIQNRIQTVDILLESLSEEEGFIIKCFYFLGLRWSLVEGRYHKEYGQFKSAQQLKCKRTTALKKMERVMRC
ncbi:MAG: hypothetical protein KAZ87_15015 [Spirochaetes bacterium]|nr:hypothetical protein [Spirochaetota bacterium]